jgi:esterase/lipase
MYSSKLILKWFSFGLSTVLVIVIVFLLLPVSPRLEAKPLTNYSFMQAIQVWNDNVPNEINVNKQFCSDRIMHQGKPTQKVIILFHGFTNCSQQFASFGRELWQQGYTVLIPRLPYHGAQDRLGDNLTNLKSTDLINKVTQTMSIAKSLAREVEVMGISAGANLALWASASYRVSKAVIIAPMIAPTTYSLWTMPLFKKYIAYMPNENKWWNDELKEKVPGPEYAYPKYSSKAALAFFEVSQNVLAEIDYQKSKFATKLHLVLLNGDKAINNQAARDYIKQIQPAFEPQSTEYVFEAKTGLQHDMIDPNQPQARTDVVYPKLLEILIS